MQDRTDMPIWSSLSWQLTKCVCWVPMIEDPEHSPLGRRVEEMYVRYQHRRVICHRIYATNRWHTEWCASQARGLRESCPAFLFCMPPCVPLLPYAVSAIYRVALVRCRINPFSWPGQAKSVKSYALTSDTCVQNCNQSIRPIFAR